MVRAIGVSADNGFPLCDQNCLHFQSLPVSRKVPISPNTRRVVRPIEWHLWLANPVSDRHQAIAGNAPVALFIAGEAARALTPIGQKRNISFQSLNRVIVTAS